MIAEFSTYSHSHLNRPFEDDCQVLEEVYVLNCGMWCYYLMLIRVKACIEEFYVKWFLYAKLLLIQFIEYLMKKHYEHVLCMCMHKYIIS